MNREQFIAHVRNEQNALRSFLLALCCGDAAEADDLAQETLVKAYLAMGRYYDEGKFHSWLFKIAYNTFLNHLSAVRPSLSLDEASKVRAGESADSGFKHQELYLALSDLPPRERSAVTLYYLDGCPIKDISRITGCSADAVKKQLSRGREQLRKTINK